MAAKPPLFVAQASFARGAFTLLHWARLRSKTKPTGETPVLHGLALTEHRPPETQAGRKIDFFLLVDKLVGMKVEETGLFAAKTHLSEMVSRVESLGVVYRITKRGKPVAELRPIAEGRPKIRLPFGYGSGSVTYIAPDFDAPLEDLRDYME